MTILAVDIGNTTITFGIVDERKVISVSAIRTDVARPFFLEKKIRKEVRRLFEEFPLVEKTVVCSVVPKALTLVKQALKKFSKDTLVAGEDIPVPIKSLYNPAQIGQDRLVCAYAAMKLYGAPAVVIDLGTAITLDVVSRDGIYKGGIIVPGIRLSAESLYQKTALLPRIDIYKPRVLIGKNTESSILSGIFHGYGAMIGGLISQITNEIKGKPKVIVTGGYAGILKHYIRQKIDIIDADLVLKGLQLLSGSI